MTAPSDASKKETPIDIKEILNTIQNLERDKQELLDRLDRHRSEIDELKGA